MWVQHNNMIVNLDKVAVVARKGSSVQFQEKVELGSPYIKFELETQDQADAVFEQISSNMGVLSE